MLTAFMSSLWLRLTGVHPSLKDVEVRRKSRLLSAGLVVMTAVFAMVDAAYSLTQPDYHPPYYGYAFLLSSYLLNRLGQYHLAASIVVAMFTVVPLSHLLSDDAAFPQMTLSYLSLAPALGAILLSARAVSFLALLNLTLIALVPLYAPGALSHATLVGPLSLTAMSGLLAVLVMYHRGQLERDRLSTIADSEQRLRLALDAARMGIWDMDMATGAVVTTPGVARMFGLPERKQIDSYECYRKTIHPDDRAAVEAALQSPKGEDATALEVTHRVLWPDGTVRWVELSGRVIRDRDGKELRRMGTLVDVTERKLLEEQLGQAQKLEAVGRLAGGVAHDFNNLLTVILGNLELLKVHQTPQLVTSIERAAVSAASLTQQLLAFSRRAVISPRVVVLDEVLRATTSMLDRIIGEDVRTVLKLSDHPWSIRVDEGQIQQIVLNLATNARDAMARGGSFTIETRNVSLRADNLPRVDGARPGDYVMLSVSDDGVGMSPEVQQRVFEPFFTTKPVGKGTGLGLSMVFGLVTQSEGFITVESEPDKGTTFKLYFPRIEVRGEATAPVEHPPAAHSGQETILLVEDEAAVREVATKMLELAGYRVFAVDSPRAATELWAEHGDAVDLLITDLVMPGGPGRELARNLQHERRQRIEGAELPVLFVTGYDPTTSREASHTQLLRKPFTREQLLTATHHLLDAHPRRPVERSA